MSERELRQLVREAVARHLAQRNRHHDPDGALQHPSHARFAGLEPDRAEGPVHCVIEPRVLCTHCGFCKAYGH